MQARPLPRRANAQAALSSLLLLLAALPCHADLPLPFDEISVGGRPPRTRPQLSARQPRGSFIIAPPPGPAVPMVELPPAEAPAAPPTAVPGGAGRSPCACCLSAVVPAPLPSSGVRVTQRCGRSTVGHTRTALRRTATPGPYTRAPNRHCRCATATVPSVPVCAVPLVTAQLVPITV